MEQKQVSLKELIHFTDRQLEAVKEADKHRYMLFGGAAGPGKSYWLRWYPVRTLIKWGKELNLRGIHGALFSKDFPTLKDRQVSKMEVEFPRWLGEIKNSQTEGLAFHIKPEWGGHVLALRNLDDPSKYLSSEFAIIAVEELTENQEEVFTRLRNRMRWTGIERTQFIGATNPGGIGHAWVKKRWIDKQHPPEEQEPEEFGFVPALPKDNKYLADSYMKQLASLPEKLRKAYLDGNWDVFEGQFFTIWDRTKHIVEPFELAPTFKRFRAYDYGHENPACCLWGALDYDGNVWIYREKYWPKGHKTDADQQAQEILRLSGDETYQYSVADPAIFSPTGMVDKYGGQTIAETFARHGIIWLPASNRRVDGWSLVNKYLRWDETTSPKIRYFSTCKDSIRTLPSLVHDELHPEDVDSDGEDHAADTVRYLLMSLHEGKATAPKNETERMLEAFKAKDNLSPSNLNDFYLDV